MEYHGNFGHTLGRIQHIALMSRIDSCYVTCCLATQNVAPTLPGYIWLVTHMNLSFILLIIMMDQISSGLHGVEIKLKIAQTRIVWNVIKMQIMPELSTEDGQFRVLYILCLVLLSAEKYRFNQL